jgi:hypothetical protein
MAPYLNRLRTPELTDNREADSGVILIIGVFSSIEELEELL